MDGFLYIDKSEGLTSRDVVNQIVKIYGTKKVGHTGTLDPLATGVLIVGIGRATKLIDEVTSYYKEYEATVKLGIQTDTLDITGEIQEEVPFKMPSKEKLNDVLTSFLGKSMQEVPKYSAVRLNGKRLYDYARSHEKVELPKRKIDIKEITLLDVTKDTFSFRVTVSKGTYIRSLIRDIGLNLGIPCTMSSLRRTKVGSIKVEDCLSLDSITPTTKVHSLDEVLDKYPVYELSPKEEKYVLNGNKLKNKTYGSKVRMKVKDELLALYKVDEKDSSMLKCDVLLKVKK